MIFKKLTEITAQDIQALVDTKEQESEELEFKQSLATRKGGQDAWLNGGPVGEEAKVDLAKEVVAFANTFGGYVVLGIAEDNSNRAASIEPLPKCKALADNLRDSLLSLIEPPLFDFDCIGVEFQGGGGCVVIRVGSSGSAPHCSRKDWRCYARIGSTSQPMSMQQVQRRSVEQHRSRLEIEKQLADRPFEYERNVRVEGSDVGFGFAKGNFWRASCRATGIPLGSVSRSDVGTDQAFRMPDPVVTFQDAGGKVSTFGEPTFPNWRPMLRGIVSDIQLNPYADSDHCEVHASGLVEVKKIVAEKQRSESYKQIHAIELLSAIPRAMVMAAVFRRLIGQFRNPYVFEVAWKVPKIANLVAPISQSDLTRLIPHNEENVLRSLMLNDDSDLGILWQDVQREFFQSFGLTVGNIYPLHLEEAVERCYEQCNGLRS